MTQQAAQFFHRSPVTRHAPLVLCAALFAGCAIPEVPSRVVYEDPASYVRVETDRDVEWRDPRDRFSHPARITAEDMAAILRGISVREHRMWLQTGLFGEAKPEPAFRDDEISLLAPRLSEALGRAKPDERVSFYVSQPLTSIKREITTGGLYVRGGLLHFILSNHRMLYGIPAYGMVYDRRYPMQPIAAKSFDVLFEPERAVVPYEASLWEQLWGWEPDEILIDPNLLRHGEIAARLSLPAQRK
jgi:hypothetical protein